MPQTLDVLIGFTLVMLIMSAAVTMITQFVGTWLFNLKGGQWIRLGKGFIGETGFRLIMNDPLLKGRPMLLETPKGDDCAEDRENMDFLRSLIG